MSQHWKVEHKYPEFLSEEEVSIEATSTNGHSIPYLLTSSLFYLNMCKLMYIIVTFHPPVSP